MKMNFLFFLFSFYNVGCLFFHRYSIQKFHVLMIALTPKKQLKIPVQLDVVKSSFRIDQTGIMLWIPSPNLKVKMNIHILLLRLLCASVLHDERKINYKCIKNLSMSYYKTITTLSRGHRAQGQWNRNGTSQLYLINLIMCLFFFAAILFLF